VSKSPVISSFEVRAVMISPDLRRALEPVLPHRVEAQPLEDALLRREMAREHRQELLGVHKIAVVGKAHWRKPGLSLDLGLRRQVHPDPDGEPVDGLPLAGALQKDARHLPARKQHVVRPFERERSVADMHRERGIERVRCHEGPQRRPCGMPARPHHQRRGEIALGHLPPPSTAATRGRLTGAP
jgi:hypothetical protein